jgi:glycosyltransferase involved in cell wall biosynthesis
MMALPLKVSILTAGRDPYYALGLLSGLASSPIQIDFVGDDKMRDAPAATAPNVCYVELHRESPAGSSLLRKAFTVISQYVSLMRNAATTDSRVFHVLWYYKAEWFDNSVLLAFYKALGKRVVLTVHNVNRKERDGKHDPLNRWSLKFLYRNVDHIFVHTRQMKAELLTEFRVPEERITVIPFGANSFTFRTGLTRQGARERLGLPSGERVLLFFGNIAPYKGLDLLVDALEVTPGCRLVIAGPVKKGFEAYWQGVSRAIQSKGLSGRVIKAVTFIPDEDVEVYFKAADVLILPYKTISQSGVLFLSYDFGLPVIATGVGGLSESIEEGVTGYVCRPDDPGDLAEKIAVYFRSDIYANLAERREAIIQRVRERHSWTGIAARICHVYARVAASDFPTGRLCADSAERRER